MEGSDIKKSEGFLSLEADVKRHYFQNRKNAL